MRNFFDPLNRDITCLVKNDVAVFPHYHQHDGYEIFILLNGDANYFIEQHCYHLSRGSLVIIRPDESHRSELLDHSVYERIVINIRSPFSETLSTEQTNLNACFLNRPRSEKNLLQLNNVELQELLVLSRQLQAVLEKDCYGCDCLALSYLLQILVKTNQLYQKVSALGSAAWPDVMPELVRDTMTYIEAHLTEPISLANLSEVLFHNGTYISRRFKSVTGLTIQQYILYKRISLAQQYLQQGYSVTDVCWMSGFNNYSNFSRSFAHQVGCSPKKYQNAYTPPRKVLTIYLFILYIQTFSFKKGGNEQLHSAFVSEHRIRNILCTPNRVFRFRLIFSKKFNRAYLTTPFCRTLLPSALPPAVPPSRTALRL